MADFGGIRLEQDTMFGASFGLSRKSSDSWCQKLEDGSEVEIKADSKAVVVRIPGTAEYAAAYERALASCQMGLDLIAMRRGLAFAIESPDKTHSVWLKDDTGVIRIRFVDFVELKADAPPVRVVVTDQFGNVQPDPPEPGWDPSFRYYRLAQNTSDVTDAYRNMFLMLESLLSAIRPRRRGEGEGAWLLAALKDAHAKYDLSRFGKVSAGSEAEDLRRDFATDARHQINHAKRQQTASLPLDSTLRAEISEKLERLASMCLWLAEQELGVHRVQGGVFPAALKRGIDHALSAGSLIVTDEAGELDPKVTKIPISAEAKTGASF